MQEKLIIRGAREHNLKDISLDLPRDSLIVFTGLSGSGKSSLAFDTIFAEGQRRYVESLSAYARQFLGQMDKPDVDFIEGLSPAVSIDQKSTSKNPRSTVGTITEVYDYLRLLYARAGRPHCPVCHSPIERQTPQQIVDRVMALDEGTRFQVLAPVIRGRKGEYIELFRELQTQGFSRARVNGETHALEDPPKLDKQKKHTIEVVVDRLAVKASSQAPAHRLGRDRAQPRRRPGHLRSRRPAGEGPGPRAEVQREDGLPQRPPDRHRRARAAVVLLQQPVRCLPGVQWPRHPHGGRPGAGRPRHAGDPGRGRDPAVEPGPRRRLLPAADERAGGGARLRPQHALGGPPGQGPDVDPRRSLDQGPRRDPQPLRPRARLLGGVRGRPHLHRAASPRGRVRHQPRAVRGVHARGALPRLPGQPAQAGLDGGDARRHGRRRQEHRRGLCPADQRDGRVPARRRAECAGAADRRAGAQGDPGAAQLPARRRPRLPLAQPTVRLAVRWRGAADPAGDPDRRRPGRRPLRPRRALDRAAPARQPPADRHPGPAEGPRQHPDHRRARPGHHRDRRLGGRHRPGRRRARRPGGAQRQRRRPADPPRLDHGRSTSPAVARSRSRRSAGPARPVAS